MKEIVNSIAETIKNRLTNPVYGTFVISWIIFHWNFIFSILFLSEDKILETTGLLKNDYLVYRFFSLTDWYLYVSWLAPFLLTWIIIWKLPEWILIRAYKKNEEYETEKIIIKIIEERKIEEEKTKYEKEIVKKTKEVPEKKEEEKKIKNIDPTMEWGEELKNITQNPLIVQAIQNGVRAIYQTNGEFTTRAERGGMSITYIQPDFLSRLDTLGLIEITKGTYGSKMNFTNKGKFFVRELQNQSKIQ